jgi:hypothetical protein
VCASGKLSFPVFDATFYINKPDLSKDGMSPFNLMYSVKLWNYREKRDLPNIAKIKEVSGKLDVKLVLCVDIEDWPVIGDANVVSSSIDKYTTVASVIRDTNPAVKFGFYGVFPVRDYWRAIGQRGPKQYDTWVQENNRLKPLAEKVDFVFPSLYTFYPDEKQWVNFAIANLKEARKYNKPVYAYLWPQYHDSTIYKGRHIPGSYWRLQLETCLKYADGIVIWGGHDEHWDEDAPWWIETKRFLKEINK